MLTLQGILCEQDKMKKLGYTLNSDASFSNSLLQESQTFDSDVLYSTILHIRHVTAWTKADSDIFLLTLLPQELYHFNFICHLPGSNPHTKCEKRQHHHEKG